ncbi:MAG: polyprenyl synthetase family protein [Pseudomonadota bacterium]
MDTMTRIEHALEAAIAGSESPRCPPGLAQALHYAVFPGGARIRPRLCLAVAMACGDDEPAVADHAAAAIELLHCASLVHDDLPCFDDAATRRGKPAVHRAFGERLAVLSGDALIVMAFQTLVRGAARAPARLAPLMVTIGRGVGAPAGIVAGQAWECEPRVALAEYHRSKTGALFAAATMAGAAAAGSDPGAWSTLGERLGEAYQVADDVRDVASNAKDLGKPVGRDTALGRPSAVRELGVAGAVKRLEKLVTRAVESIPLCLGADALRAHILLEAEGLLPKKLTRRAA